MAYRPRLAICPHATGAFSYGNPRKRALMSASGGAGPSAAEHYQTAFQPLLYGVALAIVLTFFLMLVILSVSTGAKEKGITAGIAIGAVIALEAMFAGPICGASMNPARSLSPAVVSGHLEHLWIYLAAPVIGAALAVPACCAFREPDCCCKQPTL